MTLFLNFESMNVMREAPMKSLYTVILAAALSTSFAAEARTWTAKNGQTIEGEYMSLSGDNVFIEKPDKTTIKLPMATLSEEDQLFIELENPPRLKVEKRESLKPVQYVADPWISNFGGSVDNHAIFVTDAKFGAEVVQTSVQSYNHELVAEMYVLTKQVYDPSKYHIIANFTSKPFKLTKENKRRHLFEDDRVYKILKYNLYSTRKRGEALGEYLMLVRDSRGEIIAYDGTKNWLFKNLDKLEALPVGAWINDDCERVHPTSPEWTQ